MDRNTLTGILLIGAIFIAFLIMNNEQQKPAGSSDKKEELQIADASNEKDSLNTISANIK